MNKHVLLAMKYFSDKRSVSKSELKENRDSASADFYACAAFVAINAAYVSAAAAAFSVASDAYEDATISKYFEITGESEQDYIDKIEEGL